MFSAKVVAANLAKLESAFKFETRPYSIAEVEEFTRGLQGAVDKKGLPLRPLTPSEDIFIKNEMILTKVDFRYWAERYSTINVKGRGTGHLVPFLDSQEFLLSKIAAIELDIFEGRRLDGILLNVLKAARQVGVSTLAEMIGAHKFSTQDGLFGLIAAGVPDDSGYLFGMLELCLESLPWFLRPAEKSHVKNSEIEFDGGSHIWLGAGKSMKGVAGARGNLGRGRTLAFVHLTELSTWEFPDQIDDALMPTMHEQVLPFAIFESTAKGRDNWWHRHWKLNKDGKHRFKNVFIPWYAEPRYSKPAPPDWTPLPSTIAHGNRCEETSPRWFGRVFHLTREQLYWYETKRAYSESPEKDDLRKFLEEYGSADDDECFQLSGKGIFKPKLIQEMVDRARPLAAMVEVKPMKEII